jgi:ubiquinone/menaquinone biosynthesis C-methylase UbiE
LPEVGVERVGITDQFLAEAETYDAKYGHHVEEHRRRLLEAFAAVGYVPGSGRLILDIGTGGGSNTVMPLLDIFEGSRIIATDLSPDLLRLLRSWLVEKALTDRVACVNTDAMNDHLVAHRFDVVTGCAILHHLLDPKRALATAYRALKDGGVALFFEPFEGCGLVRLAFTLILEQAQRDGLELDPRLAAFMAAMCLDFATRAQTDRSAEHFRYMDDKWLFTRHYFETAAREVGFRKLTIIPDGYGASLYRNYVASLLQLGTGLGIEELPAWTLAIIETIDASFTPEMKRELHVEGMVVFEK